MASPLNIQHKSLRFASSPLHSRPRMLKDFLKDDSCSCSSHEPSPLLLRSKSRAATTTISAINKVINVVKYFPFASVKSPLFLAKSVSRKISRSRKNNPNEKTVKIKDILRWKSFRDVADGRSASMDQCNTRTTEDLPLWNSEHDGWSSEHSVGVGLGIRYLPKDPIALSSPCNTTITARNHKGELSYNEWEQHSPVSVLDSPFQEDDAFTSPRHPSFAKTQRRKCMFMPRFQEVENDNEMENLTQAIFEGQDDKKEELNEVEQKAKQLLHNVKATTSLGENCSSVDHLLLDFFMNELSMDGNMINTEKFDCAISKIAKSWLNNNYDESFDWEVQESRGAYGKDMERGVRWNKFQEEQDQLAMQMEIMMLNDLLDDFLADLINIS